MSRNSAIHYSRTCHSAPYISATSLCSIQSGVSLYSSSHIAYSIAYVSVNQRLCNVANVFSVAYELGDNCYRSVIGFSCYIPWGRPVFCETLEVPHASPLALSWLHSSTGHPHEIYRVLYTYPSWQGYCLSHTCLTVTCMWGMKQWRTNSCAFLITLPNDVTWVYCCWETRFSLVGVACVL